jgi:hypothetical protein
MVPREIVINESILAWSSHVRSCVKYILWLNPNWHFQILNPVVAMNECIQYNISFLIDLLVGKRYHSELQCCAYIIQMVHSTYANILKNIYKKVRKIVGIGWIG